MTVRTHQLAGSLWCTAPLFVLFDARMSRMAAAVPVLKLGAWARATR